MKNCFMLILLILLVLFVNITFAQETDPPGWPCTGTTSSSTQYTNSTLTLKVILVEFSDIEHRNQTQDSKDPYTFDDFEDMLFSNGEYVSPNMYSPDNQSIFGSLRDYYYIMSDGNLTITGTILNNDDDDDDVPDWLVLDSSKSYYNEGSSVTFYNEVISKANSANLSIGTLGTYTKLAIIYAGHSYRLKSDDSTRGGLSPRASSSSNYYIMSEQFAPATPYNSEHASRKFSHIGIHAHELGHLLGFPDLYYPSNNNGWWDLMGSGNFNGPAYSGACPAPLNPKLRNLKGWVSFDAITSDQSYQADYYLQDPEVFKINKTSSSTEYFLIECRRFDQNMTIGTTSCDDYNNYIPHGNETQGIIVWRVSSTVPHGRILHANGLEWPIGNIGNSGDLFPGSRGVNVLSPWSDHGTSKWVPNTKTSTNCGMEITSTGSGYYQIDVYSLDPEDASPSYPKDFELSWSGNNPRLDWEENTEPDLSHYNIYKKDGASYSLLSTTTNEYYIDYTETQYTIGNTKEYVYYKITAEDDDEYESIYTDAKNAAVNGSSQQNKIEDDEIYDINKIPDEFCLNENYPNPFNPSTNITYELPQNAHVKLAVYNSLGQVVNTLVNQGKSAGRYSVEFNASNLPSGVYFYRIQAGEYVSVKKMLLMK